MVEIIASPTPTDSRAFRLPSLGRVASPAVTSGDAYDGCLSGSPKGAALR